MIINRIIAQNYSIVKVKGSKMFGYGKRLKEIRTKLGLTQKEFGKKLGLEWHKIKNIETEKHKLTPDIAEKIEQIYSTNGWWLLTGKGSMHTNDNSLQKTEDKDTIEIDKLSLKASAGTGIENFEVDTVGRIKLSSSVFRTKPNPKNLKVIEVIGDSMEPTLQEGDIVVIDTNATYTIDGIYAINIQGEVFIKRLQFKLDGTIKIISDNQKYETMIYNPKESEHINFNVIGRKVLLIQR